MSSITTSNKSSSVVQSLQKYKDEDSFVYRLNLSLPNHSREILSEVKTGLTANAQTVNFNVVKAGLLSQAWLKLNIDYSGGAAEAATDHAINLINRVSLQNNNRVLEDLFPQSIRGYINKQSAGYREKLELLVASVQESTTTTAYDVWIPLPFSCFESPEKYLDTGFLDSLTINVQLNAFSTVMTGGTWTAASCTLYSEYVTMDEESYAKYREMQFPAGKPVEMLWENSYQENDLAGSAATSFTVNLACDHVITESHIRLLNTNAANDFFAVENIARASNVINIQLKGNGKTLYEVNPLFLSGMRKDSHAVGGTVGAKAGTLDGNIRIDWTLADVAELKDAYTGGISLKNVSGPQLVITVAANRDANDTFQVMHTYLQFVKIMPNSGRMEVSAAM